MSADMFYRWLSRKTLAHKLTWIGMVIVAVVRALACGSFAPYDLWTSRARMVRETTMLADVVGINSTAALMFNDADAAKETLSAMSADEHVEAARLYDRHGATL